jgi:hypothetical protein
MSRRMTTRAAARKISSAGFVRGREPVLISGGLLLVADEQAATL